MAASRDQRDVARSQLLRTAPFTLERAAEGEAEDDGLTLRGHAAVFNQLTLIDSWEGRFNEQCAPGCFKKTFRERMPVLQFDHGRHALVGSIPIGKLIRAEEDDIGADVEGRLHDNWLIQPVRDAIDSGSVNGMSFRFTVVRDEWVGEDGRKLRDDAEVMAVLWGGEETPTRTLKEVKVPELGPVVFPAYTGTDVGVRSGTTTTVIDLARLRSDPAEGRRLARLLWMAEGMKRGDTEVPNVPDTAPAQQGHPVPDDDAPPADGHPSERTTSTSSDTAHEPDHAAAVLARTQAVLTRLRERSTS